MNQLLSHQLTKGQGQMRADLTAGLTNGCLANTRQNQ